MLLIRRTKARHQRCGGELFHDGPELYCFTCGTLNLPLPPISAAADIPDFSLWECEHCPFTCKWGEGNAGAINRHILTHARAS